MSIMNSINTNVAAQVALNNLNNTNRDLSAVQNRVSTGLNVSSAREDASVFSVAQGIRADIRGYDAVGQALSGGKGVVNVALEATTEVSNLNQEIQAKITQLSDESLSDKQRELYTDDLRQQVLQAKTFIDRAEYNEKNLIGGEATAGDGLNTDDLDAPEDQLVIQGVDGSSLTLRSVNLSGELVDTTGDGTEDNVGGWLGLARLVFETENDSYDGGGDLTTEQIAAAGSGDTLADLTGRTQVTAEMARAALGNTAGQIFDPATAGDIDLDTTYFANAFTNFVDEVDNALGVLGADNRNIEFQQEFNESLRDAVDEGLGNLVDADLARESGRLQALQTKQQLATQTLGIANQNPQQILGLFA